MDVALGFQAGIAPPPVRVHHIAEGNGIQNESVQTFGRCIRNQTETDAPDAPAILLRCYNNQRLGLDQTAAQSFFLAAQKALVNFYPSGQQIAPGPYHRAAQLLQPGPGDLILLQTQHAL